MIKLLTYWIIGVVILAIISAFAVVSLMLYEAVQQEYFFVVFIIMFVVIPAIVGGAIYTVKEWILNLKGGE